MRQRSLEALATKASCGTDNSLLRYLGKRSTNDGTTWMEWVQQPCRASSRQLLAPPAADTLLLLCEQG